jgi:serine protease Do
MVSQVHNRSLILISLIFALAASSSAQNSQRKPIPQKPAAQSQTEAQDEMIAFMQATPVGWVYVTQTIDLARQLGGEENIWPLDGGPLPSMLRKRVTLGLLIDDEGHIITRLIDVTPSIPPLELSVKAPGSRPVEAKFLGMDAVTGLCILKSAGPSDGPKLKPATFHTSSLLPARLNIRLYGFHPKQALNLGPAVISQSPRTSYYTGQISKAIGDFRYSGNNPIYHLTSPQMTPVQDCSLIFDRENSVFGLAFYEPGGEAPHLVYPSAHLLKIAQSVIRSNHSIAHGWLGAYGIDAAQNMPEAVRRLQNETLGVRVTAVAPDSPAEIAGVQPKDILLAVNEQRVMTYAHLASLIKRLPAESPITLKVRRGGEYKFLKAKLEFAPAIEPEQQLVAFTRRLENMEGELRTMPPNDPNRQRLESRVGLMRVFVGAVTGPAPQEIRLRVLYGFEVLPLTGQLMKYFAVTNGLLVSNVIENNKAGRAGLMAGDIILKVGDSTIGNFGNLIQALDDNSKGSIPLTISRQRDQLKINLSR